jgi:hypothetical protein
VKVGLIGSSESLIGAALTDIAANHSRHDDDLQFRRSVAWEASEVDVDELLRHRQDDYEYAVEQALRPGVLPHQHRLAFLAKTISHNDRLLVATPIYVALAD